MAYAVSVPLSGVTHVDPLVSGVKWTDGTDDGSLVLTYSFPTSSTHYANNYGAYDEPQNGFTAFTAEQQAAAVSVLDAWAAVSGITFVEASDPATADIRFGMTSATTLGTAHAYGPGNGGDGAGGDVWFDGDRSWDFTPGGHGYMTLMHEVGHALGLSHSHEASGDSTIAPLDEDWLGYTVMSYRDNPDDAIDYYETHEYPTTPMANDVAAIQYLYGVDSTHNAGDTTYSWTAGESIYEALWDSGGNDTIDWSNQTSDAAINLAAGEWSKLGPSFWNGNYTQHETMMIALGVVIENAIGGSGDDTLTGNSASNLLTGNDGADDLSGAGGSDTLEGGNGNDVLHGNAGYDTLKGGSGHDRAVYDGSSSGFSVVEGNGFWTVTDNSSFHGDEGVDKLYGIEEIYFAGDNVVMQLDNSSGGDDTTPGDETTPGETITGSDGSDLLVGGNGSDTIAGGEGSDNLQGGEGSDRMLGQNGDDQLFGGLGNDNLHGGNGTDTLNGGDGADTLFGQHGDDSLYGDIGADTLKGGDGTDSLNGGGGSDRLVGQDGSDVIDGGLGNDKLIGGSGLDTLTGGNGSDTLRGGTENDVLSGGNGFDTLNGGWGSDTLYGGEGGDILVGKRGYDVLVGGNGNDELNGGDGRDLFVFRTGDDEDMIRDFKAGDNDVDIIKLELGHEFDTYDEVMEVALQEGNNTVLNFGGGDSITLVGVNKNDLHANDFEFV